MTLEDYLARPDAMNLTALSAAVGVSKARLSQIKSSGKWPPHLALKVEAATDGKIDASSISEVVADARASA
ncbi:hypothetical protein [Sphingopyxis witflariensis]|uniref:Uncharacterized protein n=1 Tax=Sphingopyxis witflariensis TaxID=173675 RepID=A0A246JZN3_9SPHN|nr:hypothetical protein [Sphingopyxis witflariensis]OWQ97996.1 hypothetical protein CDQ91_10270 [Sphingopyxis witflariensis]